MSSRYDICELIFLIEHRLPRHLLLSLCLATPVFHSVATTIPFTRPRPPQVFNDMTMIQILRENSSRAFVWYHQHSSTTTFRLTSSCHATRRLDSQENVNKNKSEPGFSAMFCWHLSEYCSKPRGCASQKFIVFFLSAEQPQ